MKRTNAIRTLSLSVLLAASGLAAPAFGQINVSINLAPPPPQHEVVPVVQPGYVWTPGYWGWNGDRHVWIRGRPIVQREGYRWERDRWESRNQGYYHAVGHWERDRDFKPAKRKKEKDRDDGERGERGDRDHGHDNGKHGRGGKHGD